MCRAEINLIRCAETTLSYASIMGLKQDLDLKGDEYQWLGSLFYFGECRSSEDVEGGLG